MIDGAGACLFFGSRRNPRKSTSSRKESSADGQEASISTARKSSKNDNEGMANHRRANAKRAALTLLKSSTAPFRPKGIPNRRQNDHVFHSGCHTAMMVNLKLSGWTGSCLNADFISSVELRRAMSPSGEVPKRPRKRRAIAALAAELHV